MKRIAIAILLAAAMLITLVACGGGPVTPNATATNDPQTTRVMLTVTLPDGTQNRQELSSTKSTLGEVLDDYGLIERDDTGMVIAVSGVEAIYEKDQAYWAFYVDGEFAMLGVDDEIIAEGKSYELRYTKD